MHARNRTVHTVDRPHPQRGIDHSTIAGEETPFMPRVILIREELNIVHLVKVNPRRFLVEVRHRSIDDLVAGIAQCAKKQLVAVGHHGSNSVVPRDDVHRGGVVKEIPIPPLRLLGCPLRTVALNRVPERPHQRGPVSSLGQVVLSTNMQGLQRHRIIRKTGQHDDWDIGGSASHTLHGGKTVTVGQ